MSAKAMLAAFWGLFMKEAIRILRIWPQTLLPSAITMVLYFMIFGHVIGHRVGLMRGVPYMVYITPGLIMMAVIINSYSNVVSSFFGARYNRSIEELLVSPMPNWLIILGYTAGGMFRGLIVGGIVTAIGIIFSGLRIEHPWLTLFAMLLCSFLFCLAGLVNGIFSRKFDDTSIITTFVLTPLTYLGGVFYSIALLPPIWRFVSRFNPIHYVIELFRYAMLSSPNSDMGLWFPLTLVLAITIALFVLAVTLMNKGIGLKV